jgi:uncharacterized protein YjbI with pentapeptide repeats
MADQSHLEILQQGVRAWNSWRERNLSIKPDLSEANLNGAYLGGANLSGANLTGSVLVGTNLTEATLTGCSFMGFLLGT